MNRLFQSFGPSTDTVFEGRNRAYGAYELRTNYPRTLSRVMLSWLGLLLVLSIYVLFSRSSPFRIFIPKIDHVITVSDIDLFNDIVTPPAPPPTGGPTQPPPRPSDPSRQSSFVIDPTDHSNQGPHDPNDQNPDNHAGNGNSSGTGTSTGNPGQPGGEGGGGPGGDPNEIHITVNGRQAEFPGGMEALIDYLGRETHITSDMDVVATVYVQFVVETDGRVNLVEVKNSVPFAYAQEAVRVISGMPNWTPADNNGHPVRMLFTIPIRFEPR